MIHANSRSMGGWLRAFFTDDDPAASELQGRAFWVGCSLLLQSLSELVQITKGTIAAWLPAPLGNLVVILPFLLMLGGFFFLWQALRPGKPRVPGGRWRQNALVVMLLVAIVGVVFCVLSVILCFLPPRFPNDGTSLDTNAAVLLAQGHNPYTDSNIFDVARRFGISPDWTTPLRLGPFAGHFDYPSSQEIHAAFQQGLHSGHANTFESKVSYPAFAFLSLLPFILLQHMNVLPFYLLSYLLLIVIGWKFIQPALRPWLLLLALINIPMWDSTFNSNLDVFCALLTTLAWLTREKRWQSVCLLGLAIASKQVVWLLVPFYLLMIWRTMTPREALLRTGAALALALLINLPFILWNPQAWLAGMLAPIADPMFPLGVGMITLSIAHLLPYFPGWVYGTLEAVTMLWMLAWYWRLCRWRPEVAILLAMLPLLFAWRSLPSYFACITFPLFILLVVRKKEDHTASALSARETVAASSIHV